MAALSRLTTTAAGVDQLLTKGPPPLLLRQLTRSYRISSAAAAQPQLDYDRYYGYYNDNRDCDSGGGERNSSPVTDTEGATPRRGVQWVFIGSPNAKKHVYADMISKLLEVPHISISSLLRQDLNPHSPIYKQIAYAIDRGKLVPESIIFGLLSKRLEDGDYRGETGFILDGIPRTRLQAEILDQLVDIDLVVNFKCSEDNFQAGGSASDSSIPSSSPKASHSGSDKVLEGSEPKISTFYRQQKKLLEDYYQGQDKLIDFQVGKAPGETWKGLIAALHLQHIDAFHSSRILTMDLHQTLRF